MSIQVSFRGTTYRIPSPGETGNWATSLNALLKAIGLSFPDVKVSLTGTSAVAPLRLVPSAQPSGPNVVGDLYMTTAGVVKVCTVAGTPGTWVSVGGQT